MTYREPTMELGSHPRTVTSRKRITYRRSSWRVHEFDVGGGELSCRVAALRVEGGLLLWLGGAGEPQLGEVALGVPAPAQGESADAGAGELARPVSVGLATTLVGTEGAAAALARRLAVKLARPVYICSGTSFDRFTIPLVERGLISEIKSSPEKF